MIGTHLTNTQHVKMCPCDIFVLLITYGCYLDPFPKSLTQYWLMQSLEKCLFENLSVATKVVIEWHTKSGNGVCVYLVSWSCWYVFWWVCLGTFIHSVVVHKYCKMNSGDMSGMVAMCMAALSINQMASLVTSSTQHMHPSNYGVILSQISSEPKNMI